MQFDSSIFFKCYVFFEMIYYGNSKNLILNFIFFQDWGKPGDIHNLGINWHIPNESEISAAQKLIDEFLFDELNNLSEFSKGTILLNRDQLLNRLNVVSNILYGCGSILPFWKSAKKFDDDFCPKSLVDSVTDLTPLEFSTTTRPLELTLGGKNVRQEIAKVAFQLQVRSNDKYPTQQLFGALFVKNFKHTKYIIFKSNFSSDLKMLVAVVKINVYFLSSFKFNDLSL